MSNESPQPHSDAAAPAVRSDEKATDRQFTFELTPLAARKLYENLRKRGTPNAALRVGVRGGGCSGFAYVLEFADGEPRSRDLVFSYPVEKKPSDEEAPGEVRVFCDKKSIIYLNGTALDWLQTLMYQGFKFKNPHEKSSCGCNESFAV